MLAAPFPQLFEHFIKSLPDVNHILAAEDLYPLPIILPLQAMEAETDFTTRMFQDMNATGAIDCKPKLIEKVAITNTTASTLDVLPRASPIPSHFVMPHLRALEFHSHPRTNPVYFQ